MFYRISTFALVAAVVMITQLSNLSSIALFSSQATVSSSPQKSEVPTNASITEIRPESVAGTVASLNEDIEAPLTLASSQNYAMQLDEPSLVSVQSNGLSNIATDSATDSAWVSEISPVETEVSLATAAYAAPIAITHPNNDNTRPSFADQQTFFNAPYDDAPVAQYYVDPSPNNNVDRNYNSYAHQYVDPSIYQNFNQSVVPYAHQSPYPYVNYVNQSVMDDANRITYRPAHPNNFQPTATNAQRTYHPALYTDNYSLLQYRRLMRNSPAPSPCELQGQWRGVNKGIAVYAIDKRFIKEFFNVNGQIYGDNIDVRQNSLSYDTIADPRTGSIKRRGKYLVQQPHGIGPFKHAVILNYRKGGNRKLDPSKLIYDRVVKLDDNHMLGRATAKFGPIQIPLAYFVLQRVPH